MQLQRIKRCRAQAITEMAIFGSLMLMICAVLIGYIQRFNDQQYVQMEAFRRAQAKANTYQGPTSEGAGASVQYTLLQHRKQMDAGLSGNFRKGNTQLFSGGASVYWAIPKSGDQADSLMVYKVNEDAENVTNYRDFVPVEHDSTDDTGADRPEYWSFDTGNMTSSSNADFQETIVKSENAAGITNTKTSQSKESVAIRIPYEVTVRQTADPNYRAVAVDSTGAPIVGDLVNVQQYMYKDANDGQYKFSSQAPDEAVVTNSTWVTQW
jgi:hypothetical protein